MLFVNVVIGAMPHTVSVSARCKPIYINRLAPCTKKCSSGVAENIYYKAFGNVFVFLVSLNRDKMMA